jgi:hypothetical protein
MLSWLLVLSCVCYARGRVAFLVPTTTTLRHSHNTLTQLTEHLTHSIYLPHCDSVQLESSNPPASAPYP